MPTLDAALGFAYTALTLWFGGVAQLVRARES
jgi:hypothetical protein